MPTKNTRFYSLILILVDTLVLLIAFTLAYVARVQYDPRPLVSNVYAYDYFIAFLAIVPFWILIFATLGLYSPSTYNRRLVEWSKIAIGAFIGILLVIGWEYVSGKHIFPARLVGVYALGGSFLLILFEREILRLIRSLLFHFGRGTSRVLIIGNSEATRDIAENMSDTRKSGYHIVAIAGPRKVIPAELEVEHFSSVETALKKIKELRITTIIQTDLYEPERNQRILGAAQTNHISYSFIPGEPEFYAGKNTVDVFLGYPMISVSQTPLIGWGSIVKRLFDIVATAVILVVISPLLLVIVILQKILNPGPLFFAHKRLTRSARPFKMLKFRSMRERPTAHMDSVEEFRAMGRPDLADEYEIHRKILSQPDPRITKFGHFLRKTSLDELPQFFNVLKGDLSLVGPRPIEPVELPRYKDRGSLLLSVQSGITGLWQVSGRNNLSFEQRVELELYYAQNWSFWMDLKILLKTPGALVRRKGVPGAHEK